MAKYRGAIILFISLFNSAVYRHSVHIINLNIVSTLRYLYALQSICYKAMITIMISLKTLIDEG